MALSILAFLGGVLTILSPCILPVLPFVFSGAGRSFLRNALPLLAGMALTFTVVASAATLGGAWIVRLNVYGRVVAMVALAIFGLALIWQRLADWLAAPFLRLGNRFIEGQDAGGAPGALRSVLLGAATGLLWAPCAGPILGLILTGAADAGANSQTFLLLLTYAAGAAFSLAIVLFAGQGVFRALKRSLGLQVALRRVLGVAVLAGVAAVAMDLDRGELTRLSLAGTSGIEQALVDRLRPKSKAEPAMMMMSSTAPPKSSAPEVLPGFSGATLWINSQPLNPATLKGHVVLIDFWTYSCINCLRTLPYLRAWADRYRNAGLIVVGIHTPEFPFEKDADNVRSAVKELEVNYPVALDNDYQIWKSFSNQYWPADYVVDVSGRIRYHHFGEGKYEETEGHIQTLLKERDGQASFDSTAAATIAGTGREAPPDSDVESLETYLGYARADSFMPEGSLRHDAPFQYSVAAHLELNQWSFGGKWTVAPQVAVLEAAGGKIQYRFHARDVHMVLGSSGGRAVRYRVKIDGKPPGGNHGVDTTPSGSGIIREHRLYQLIRQRANTDDHLFEIEFLDAGAQAFSFTFG